jgi:rSAM/selenodomain-associated transferase 1
MDHANRLDGKSAASCDSAHAAVAASCGIAVMAKASAPGRAKTRLVPPLTFEEAAVLNTAFLQDVADNVLLAARDAERHGGIAGYAAYGPPGSEDFFRRTLPRGIGMIEAWRQNFGDCLLHTIEEIFARGHASAVVLNSDSPTLPTAFLVETAAALARPGDRAVLGPSSDGGYYLLGLKAVHRHMFETIAWSTERVAKQTLERAREIGLDVHRLPVWYDVDDVEGLRRLRAELSDRQESLDRQAAERSRLEKHQPRYAANTAVLMNSLHRNHDFNRRAAALFEAEPLRA